MKKISIGNDIVALANTNAARAQHPKFYSKFLTNSEADLYKDELSISFEQFAWLCWSIKESVFKFQNRLQPDFVFAPGKIHIRQINHPISQQFLNFENNIVEKTCLPKENCFSSIAVIDDISFLSHSFITDEFIYTITTDDSDCNEVFWGIKKIEKIDYDSQSQSVRVFISQKLVDLFDYQNLDILKSDIGYPYIKQHPHLPVSFTHHHDLIGYAFYFE